MGKLGDMFNWFGSSDPSDSFDEQDKIVANCPVCGKGFHESILTNILKNPQPHGLCKRCGAWLAILPDQAQFKWFLIGFGNRALPIEGRGPSEYS